MLQEEAPEKPGGSSQMILDYRLAGTEYTPRGTIRERKPEIL